ncbi:MAG: hypothetical protein PWP23_864 [Candidatus Sumerlaeota bacterium]|nr:hypothetical protein [Candidatus Sumerlaeota bacterium]
MKNAVCVAILACLGVSASAQEKTLYIADPYTGCIYASDLASPGQPPTLVSGEGLYIANEVVFLNDDEMLATIPDRITGGERLYLVNTASGVIEDLNLFDPSLQVTALMHDSGSGTVTMVLDDTDNQTEPELVLAHRDSGTGDWTTFTYGAFPDSALEDINQIRKNVTFVDEETIVISTDQYSLGRHLSYYDISVDPPVAVSDVETSHHLHLASSGDGRFLTWPAKTTPLAANEPLRVFDGTGVQLNAIAPDAAPVLAQRISGIDWQGAAHGTAIVGQSGLWTSTDPSSGTPTFSEAFSYLTEGLIDPARDLSGSTVVRKTSADTFRVFNPGSGSIVNVNTTTGKVGAEVVVKRGTGTSFGSFSDLVVAPSGILYLLDNVGSAYRLVRIDPRTGDRAVVAVFGAGLSTEHMIRAADGTFLFASPGSPVPYDSSADNLGYNLTIFRLTLTADPLAPIVEVVATGTVPSLLADFRLAPDGTPYFLLNPGDAITIGRLEDGAFVGRPNLAVMGEPMVIGYDSQISRTTLSGTLSYPGSTSPVQPRRMKIGVSFPAASISRVSFDFKEVTFPDGSTVSLEYNQDSVQNLMLGGQSYRRIVWFQPSLSVANSEGDWTLTLFRPTSQWEFTPFLLPVPAPTARRFAFAPDGTIHALQINPPLISTWDEETGTVVDLPYALPTGSGLPETLLRQPYDFTLSPDGTRAFVSFLTSPVILSVDLTTGESTVQTPGRPLAFDENFHSLQGAGTLSFVIGPKVTGDESDAWTLTGE